MIDHESGFVHPQRREGVARWAAKRLRLILLQEHGFGSFPAESIQAVTQSVEPDDMLDACAACWTAERICSGTAVCIPPAPALDSRGLRMAMWY